MDVSVEVPEISEYPQGFPIYWMKLFIGTASTNYQVNALAGTYIRLVEAALVEYRLGASRLREFWNTHDSFNQGVMFRSVAHFESCILDMYRAVNCYRSLRRHKGQDPLSLALSAEKPSFATNRVADQLRQIRHRILHLDEKLLRGEIQEGQPIALLPDGPERTHPAEPNQMIKSIDRLIIGGKELLFVDLASWLKEMGRYAEKIADFGPDSSINRVVGGLA